MRTVNVREAKQRLSELVARASERGQFGITRRGKLVALIGPLRSAVSLTKAFANIEEIRKRGKPLNGLSVKDLIEEGRR